LSDSLFRKSGFRGKDGFGVIFFEKNKKV